VRVVPALALLGLGCGGKDAHHAVVSAPAVPAVPRAAPAPSWLARLEFPTGHSARAKPTGVLAADLDSDGKDELVTVTRSPGGVEVSTGLSPAVAPAPEPRVFTIGDYPLGPVWFGSAPHAAVASRETLELAVFDAKALLEASPDVALPATWRAKLPARPRAIAGGAVEKQKKPAVGVITIDDELLVYQGPGSPRRIPLAKQHAVCALLAADGERIVVGYQETKKLVLLGPDAVVEHAVEIPGTPRALLEADLDGDGRPDLAVAAGDDLVLVFGLGRTGRWGAWLDAPPLQVHVGSVPIALAATRSGERGREDLAVLALHDQEVRVLDFAGGVATEVARRAAGQRPGDVACGDFDGDGTVDLAFANSDARRVGVLFGPFAPEPRVGCDRAPSSIASGDLNVDGRPDVAVLAAADETISVLITGYGGTFLDAVGLRSPGAQVVAFGDLVAKGRADVGWLRRGADRSALVVGFTNAREFPVEGSTDATDLLFADLAGTGRSDAVVADPEKGFVALIENQSAGEIAFGAARRTPVAAGPRALALLHGAGGELRIAVAAGGPGPERGIALLRVAKDASGAVSLGHPELLAMPQFPIAVCAADLDGDGREDLAVLARDAFGDSQSWVVPWISKVDGSWRALAAMPTGARPHRIAAADLDGDGKAEIVVTAQGSHHVELWLARAGDPVQFVRSADLGCGTGPLDLALVDLDGDGRKEIVVANGFSDDVSVIRVK
jgi:hypothetical protein